MCSILGSRRIRNGADTVPTLISTFRCVPQELARLPFLHWNRGTKLKPGRLATVDRILLDKYSLPARLIRTAARINQQHVVEHDIALILRTGGYYLKCPQWW